MNGSRTVTIEQAEIITFPERSAEDACLYVYENNCRDVPFPIARVFTVDAAEECTRGRHAHRECQQLLIAMRGIIDVKIDDGSYMQTITLDTPKKGLLIPAGIWAEQAYPANSLLMVLTDKTYDESDYLRDYSEFKNYKGTPE